MSSDFYPGETLESMQATRIAQLERELVEEKAKTSSTCPDVLHRHVLKNERIQALEQENRRLSRELAEARETNEKNVMCADEELATLRAQLATALDDLEGRTEERDNVTEYADKLRVQLADKEIDRQTAQFAADGYFAKLYAVEAELAKLREAYETLEMQGEDERIDDLRAQLATQAQQHALAREALGEARKRAAWLFTYLPSSSLFFKNAEPLLRSIDDALAALEQQP